MTNDRYDQLNPPHLVTTLRSFPRRYRGALAAALADAETLGSPVDGHRLIDLLADTVHTLAMFDRALAQTLVHDEPELPAAVADPTERQWAPSDVVDAEQLLEELTAGANTMADRIDHASTKDWSRKAKLTGDHRTVRAIDIARGAARTGAENLRIIERLVAKLPIQPANPPRRKRPI